METYKLLLEIYGKTEATNTNVIHILSRMEKQDAKLEKLHSRCDDTNKRIDTHDGYIKWGMGAFAVVGVVGGVIWEWIKAKWRS